MNNRKLKLIIIAAVTIVVTACSFKTVYNRLDYLIPEYVEGMVTLDDVLEEELEHRTTLLLHWHRNTQLKQYADWLHALQQDIGPQLTETKLEQHLDQMEMFWQSLFVKLNDEMAYLLPLLNKDQQEELFIYIEDSNEAFREEYIDLDNEERIDDYKERMTETYENWVGELSDEQLIAVEQAAAELINTAQLRLQQRLQWQRGIRQILAQDDTVESRSERLRAFLAGYEQDKEGLMKEKTNINRQIIVSLTVRISHAMSEEQIDFFINKTGEYIRIFTELAENR